MCGIVGIVSQRNIASLLIEGLKRLEYRGYDSAGMALIHNGEIQRLRQLGKVIGLEHALSKTPIQGCIGIAHTRWATHGKPSEENAHPHVSNNRVALAHNGIIENHELLRAGLIEKGYHFNSETDTEMIVHLIEDALNQYSTLKEAMVHVIPKLRGAYGLAIIGLDDPSTLLAVRKGSPLVVGLGVDENYISSDMMSMAGLAQHVIFLEEGDIAEITSNTVKIFQSSGQPIERPQQMNALSHEHTSRGQYRHFMQKEIFEQPSALAATLAGRISNGCLFDGIFGNEAHVLLRHVKHVQIVACGTSYHAGMVARYWIERLAGLSCHIEVASEFRYRENVVLPDTLFVTISQSGETADTLAALHQAKSLGYIGTLAICNVAHSSLARESDLVFMTMAGTEIGVASTKAFTTQLVALLLLTIQLGKGTRINAAAEAQLVAQLAQLPALAEQVLTLDPLIKVLAQRFMNKSHALFLGRGEAYPIACEGALKLKELSYIHAEAYPAGELKHGPLALVDEDMPVIAVAPKSELVEKLKSNLEEVRARGGKLIVFADVASKIRLDNDITVIDMPSVPMILMPIVYTLPLQLLSYHVAVLKGTDVDQPRNLAKSVTVE